MVGSGNFVYFCTSDVLAVQGHPRFRFWHQSKARMRLPISLP